MTNTTLPAAEHAHSGGSAGGPGENSAECACGVTFAGFDTHREAVELLTRHIEQENSRERKRADQLAPGDIAVDILDGFDPWVSHRDGKVLASYPYVDEVDNARVLLVVEGDGPKPKPETVRLDAEVMVGLRSEAELTAMRELAERAQQIADLRAFADFLECNPWAPMPYKHAQAEVPFEAIAEYGERVGVPADTRLDDRTQVFHRFGGFEYRVIAWHRDGRPAEPVKDEPPADDQGFGYSRVDDDPQVIRPHSPRLPLHTGGVVDGGQLVDETPAHVDIHGDPVAADALCVASLHIPAAGTSCGWCGAVGFRSAQHVEVMGTARSDGECSAECACGMAFSGFDSLREASAQLALHIEAATSPTGLTKAADESRGPLAGTTPVVTYFSFGYGQVDPDTGRELVGSYVTVVAPTYDGCREAMFASRFGNRWSFDYLAGRDSTTRAVSEWTEHEVIVAPGTDPALAEAALKAAAELLAVEPVSEAR